MELGCLAVAAVDEHFGLLLRSWSRNYCLSCLNVKETYEESEKDKEVYKTKEKNKVMRAVKGLYVAVDVEDVD